MKIAYINDQIFPSTDTDCEQIMQTVSTMGENGEDVTFVLPKKYFSKATMSKELAEFYQIEKTFLVAHVKSLFPSARFIEKSAHALASMFSKSVKTADVIYTRNLPTVIAALIFTKKKVFYETYRNWPDQLFFMGWLFRKLNKYKQFGGAVIHSKFACESYVRAGVDRSKVLAKHNGYDPKRLEPVLSKQKARKKFSLPKDQKIVTYSGHISEKKGLLQVLELADAHKNVLFVLVGSKKKTALETRAEKMENVKIIPWLKYDKVVPYLYAADILILPPTLGPLTDVGNTILPIKTFLYMACNRVIFGPDSPDLKGVLKDGVNARLVKPDSIEDAEKGLSDLLESSELCEKLAAQAYEDVKEHTYERRSSEIIDFIKQKTG